MNNRKRKVKLSLLLARRFRVARLFWQSGWNVDWDRMAPVGREFGSPDYETLSQQDGMALRTKLAKLIVKVQLHGGGDFNPSDAEERRDACNVQAVIKDLGYTVSLEVAAGVWMDYSDALKAGWMDGAESVESAKRNLLRHIVLSSS